jgi:hypothetical protein
MKRRYVCRRVPESDFIGVQVYAVADGSNEGHVWVSNRPDGKLSVRCCVCSGSLVGMSATCTHVAVVRRALKRA